MMLLYISFIKITFRINDFEILHLNNSTNLSTYDTAPRIATNFYFTPYDTVTDVSHTIYPHF